MPLRSSRRRVLAILAALPLAGRRALAQGFSSEAGPSGGDVIEDVGSWHVISQASYARAAPLEANVLTSSGKSGDGQLQGYASVQLEYWSFAGSSHGFSGTLTVSPQSNLPPSRQTFVFADGEQIDSFITKDQETFDIGKWFGEDLASLRTVGTLKVTMADDQGAQFTVYEVNLSGTDEAMQLMRSTTERYYFKSGQALHDLREQNAPDGSTSGEGCFLTTACCGLIGLDDCFELATLRRFRDEVMMQTADGRADVARYYAEAPNIVREIVRRGEQHVLLRLYVTHILPSALAARFRFDRFARGLYTRMMGRLAVYSVPSSLDGAHRRA